MYLLVAAWSLCLVPAYPGICRANSNSSLDSKKEGLDATTLQQLCQVHIICGANSNITLDSKKEGPAVTTSQQLCLVHIICGANSNITLDNKREVPAVTTSQQGWEFAHSLIHSLICSICSNQMSDCERFAQIAQDK